MLSIPPPNSGKYGSVEMSISVVWTMFWFAIAFWSTIAGLAIISAVIVPAAMKEERS